VAVVRASTTWLTHVLTALAWVVGRLPWRATGALGSPLAALVGDVLRVRRNHVEGAMARAGVDDAAQGARGMYRSLAAAVFELMWLAARAPGAVRQVATFAPGAREAIARGAVIAASHTGNWDLAVCALAQERPVSLVTKRLSVRGLDAFWQRARGRAGVSLLEADGAAREAMAALARGELVVMMIDQRPPARGVVAEFLGAQVLVDRAPAALAARAGVPLVVAAQERTRTGHVLHALAVLEPPSRERVAWIDDASRRATAALDAFVRARPAQWLWMHRRWRAISYPCAIRSTRSSSPAGPSGAA